MSDRDDPVRAGSAGRPGGIAGVLRNWSDRYDRFQRRWFATPAVVSGILLVLGILPFVLDARVFGVGLGTFLSVHILTIALVWAITAQSWNVISGFAGQFSFGHAAFFGLGAYVPLILVREFGVNPWIGMLVGGIVASLYGLFIGVLTFRFRVRGSYFTLATLAFAELLLYLFINVEALGSASGFVKPLPRSYGADFGLVAFQFRETLPYYYVALALLAVVSFVAIVIKQSRIGLYLRAIRDDEAAARAVGIPTVRYKLLAFGVSAFFTAWAGTFWTMYFSSIRPEVVFGLLVNIDILLPAVIGGIGTVAGPIVGSVVLTGASEAARQSFDLPGVQDVVYGLILLAIVLRGSGAVGSLVRRPIQRLRTILDRRGSPDEPARAGPGPGDD